MLFCLVTVSTHISNAQNPDTQKSDTQKPSANSLVVFLEAVKGHPGVKAAKANLNAAEANLSQAFDPVALEGNATYGRLQKQPKTEQPNEKNLVEDVVRFSASLSFRPFPYGDIGDLVSQRKLDMEKNRLDYREMLTNLEVQALEAASNVQLAQEALILAQEAFNLSEKALQSTQVRFKKGAANQRELRESEKGLVEAEKFLADAKANLALALLSLKSLVGEVDTPNLLEFSEPLGEPLEVLRARINIDLVSISVGSAWRDIYPTLQACYDWGVDNKTTLSASIETRTLQPKISILYDGASQGVTQCGFSQAAKIDNLFSIGISMNISPGTFDQLSSVNEQQQVAEEALAAAISSAELKHATLARDLEQALRQLHLAAVEFEHAQKVLSETKIRQEAGLSIPLETQQAAVELTEANLDLQSAKQAKLSKQLAFYKFYAIPPSEVLNYE